MGAAGLIVDDDDDDSTAVTTTKKDRGGVVGVDDMLMKAGVMKVGFRVAVVFFLYRQIKKVRL